MTRRRAFEIVEVGARGDVASRAFDIFIMALIFLNVAAVVMESVEPIGVRYETAFFWFDAASVGVFTVEYAVRVWSSVEHAEPKYHQPVAGRLRYAISPLALVDLVAILPFYLSIFVAVDLRFLRIFRLLRILKLTRYSGAMETLAAVFRSEAKPLVAAVTIMLTLLVCLSGIVYFFEREAQPEAFASIPHAMWWGMATLTTVGYGDVVPITPLGKLVGAAVTLAGLGMFALPAAILATGFARAAKRRDFTVSWNLVAHVPVFAHLRASGIADIADLLEPRLAMPGEVILRKGDRGESMFFIVSGAVEVETPCGQVTLGEGDYFGEIAVLYETQRTATVRARSTCQLLILHGHDLHALLDQHPTLRRDIEDKAQERLHAARPAELDVAR